MKSGCDGQNKSKKRSIELPVFANTLAQNADVRVSRTARWRAAVLIALNLLMVAHVVQWWIMGKTVSPIEPSEAMYTLQNGAVNAGFIFFVLAILATLIFGRFVCGWGCHILALQDLCAWLLKKVGLTPRPFRSRLLVFVPLIAALYMFVWPTVLRAIVRTPEIPLIPGFSNHLMTTEFWATFPPFWVAVPFLFICGFLTVYFLGSKGFCTYGCPYGGFFALADKIAPGKIRVTDACNQCGHCTATCTSNVIVHAEVKEFGMVVDPGCMKCMDCVSVCPNDALYFGFGKPAAAIGKAAKKNFSLAWPEEIAAALIFALSLLAVWDVYQLVPMLMALGIAGVTTFLAIRVWRLIVSKDLSFYRFNLKSGGTLKVFGILFLAYAFSWLGLVAHSGYIRYHERAGALAFQSLQIPDELALAQRDSSQWLNPSDKANIAAGRDHFNTARSRGLFTNVEAIPKLAWLEYLGGNIDGSLDLLGKAARLQDGQAKAISLYYQGAILNRLGRYEEALRTLDQAMTASNVLLAREEKGESLWMLGRKPEAVAVWTDAIRGNPGLPVVNNFLAAANASLGRTDAAAQYETQADRSTPNDPYFHWMLALRLSNLGMKDLAEKHFQAAIQLEPTFKGRR
ncbi:MAG: tetratricopeptide repeat protein [Pyrinomonadaceae bacterium]